MASYTGPGQREVQAAGIRLLEVKGSPWAEMLSDDAMQSLATESEPALAEFVVSSGEIVLPMDAHIVTAGKGWSSKEIDGARQARLRGAMLSRPASE